MERQSKNRILGILVIIGLVIILLPLFQDKTELNTQTTLAKSPPFPGQPLQDEAAISASVQDSTILEPAPASPQALNNDNPAADMMSIAHPSIVNSLQTPEDSQVTEEMPKTNNYRIIEPTKTLVKHSESGAQDANKMLVEDNGLMKLNSAVWVIQIGSFKNKTNALRIVNQLRANGYRAFLQQVTTALGDHTRVFVGPEHKRATARALADRLHSEMHIRAIVVSYKPLAL